MPGGSWEHSGVTHTSTPTLRPRPSRHWSSSLRVAKSAPPSTRSSKLSPPSPMSGKPYGSSASPIAPARATRAPAQTKDGRPYWLIGFPPNFHVVTKGRVLGTNGILSPQPDVLILHPAYPRHLREKKVYLAGGVVAAFECKLTLRNEHFEKVGELGGKLRSLLKPRTGSPYEELHSPLIFGLLAHRCQMGSNPAEAIGTKLQQILHPRDAPRHSLRKRYLNLGADNSRHPWAAICGICDVARDDLFVWLAG